MDFTAIVEVKCALFARQERRVLRREFRKGSVLRRAALITMNTRLGHVDLTLQEMVVLLSQGDVTITLSED